MDQTIRQQLIIRSQTEPFGALLGMEVTELSPGSATVRMTNRADLANIFGSTHGGALFSVIDEAFQLACNSHGVLSVALNVSITYCAAPNAAAILEATATEVHKTNRTASYACEVREVEGGKLIATAQALAYRTGKQLDPQV